jgi:hypothetical protein
MWQAMWKVACRSAELGPGERGFVAAAWLAAPAVHLSLRLTGLQRTLAWIERGASAASRVPAPRPSDGNVDRAEELVRWAFRAHPLLDQRCLPRSLVQYGLQRWGQAPVRFVVGVRKGDGTAGADPIAAHAWVEQSGAPAEDSDFARILQRSGRAPDRAPGAGRKTDRLSP